MRYATEQGGTAWKRGRLLVTRNPGRFGVWLTRPGRRGWELFVTTRLVVVNGHRFQYR